LIVLSHYQAAPILAARLRGARTATASPDLGLSMVEVTLLDQGVTFPTGERVSWADVERIAQSNNTCFWVDGDAICPVQAFSQVTGWVRSLYPTPGAPTMLVSGVPMHRIKGTDPHRDTLSKIKAVAPLIGRVLDTATGLGYTAIEAARTADEVITIELDPTSLEIARLNPWSQPLFENPKLVQMIGDAQDVIAELPPGSFHRVIHDPPAFSLAGDLYSGDFYRQLFRVLTRRGILYHYVGDPQSKSGRSVTAGVIRRLQEAGFVRVVRRPQAFGVVAYKS